MMREYLIIILKFIGTITLIASLNLREGVHAIIKFSTKLIQVASTLKIWTNATLIVLVLFQCIKYFIDAY